MIICHVVGNVWATKKEPTLEGLKLMVVRQDQDGKEMVAADIVGAGVGEQVLVVSGSTARNLYNGRELPVDHAIVGIIDEVKTIEPQKKAPVRKAKN